MKIAVITNAYPPRVSGGAARISFVYTELLRDFGHDVRVWNAKPEFDALGGMSAFQRLFFHLRDLSASQALVDDIVSWEPDVILSHNLTGCGIGTPFAIRQRLNVRWVHLLHDVQLIEPSGQIRAKESLKLFHEIWRQTWSVLRHGAMHEPDAVVSPTNWLLEFHKAFGWFSNTQTAVIPNPMSPSVSSGFMRDPKQLIYVGRVDADKGVLILRGAWRRIRDFASKLIVIGDGAELTTLRREPDVECVGPQPSGRVMRQLQESGILVVPSLILENQPTVILEGLAAGCAVIASDVGGTRETLGDAGHLVPPGDVNALVSALKICLDVEYVPRDPKRVLAEHEPRVSAQRLEDVLRSNL